MVNEGRQPTAEEIAKHVAGRTFVVDPRLTSPFGYTNDGLPTISPESLVNLVTEQRLRKGEVLSDVLPLADLE